MRLLPEIGFKLRRAGIGCILAALYHLCQCGGGQLGRFRGRFEIPHCVRSVRAHGLDIAAALQRQLGVLVLLNAAFPAPRRQHGGIGGFGGSSCRVGVLEESLAELLLGIRASGDE